MGMRRLFLTVLAVTALFGAGKVAPVHQDKNGLAIGGYDAVAYFTLHRPTKGVPEIAHSWMGATWRFASAENRDRFVAEPERYAPQFGGYCAWAVSKNYTAPADPLAWKIIDGKLYLNYNLDVQRKWEQDVATRIQAGQQNWPGLHQ